MQLHPVGIIGTGKYVPERILTNQELEQMVETNDEWIVTRTGIKERRIAAAEQATSDLAFEASKIAMRRGNHGRGFGSHHCGDDYARYLLPFHGMLGAREAWREESGGIRSLGCLFRLYLWSGHGANLIATGMYKHVLVVGAECLSRITDYTDRNTCILFGDGAGAAVLGEVPEGRGFKSFELGADGSGSELLCISGGGSRMPSSTESIASKQHFIYMAGSEVFKFAVRIMGSAAEEALRKAGMEKSEIDLLIPHQANVRIIQSALNRLNLSEEKAMINLHKYGNVSAASIPIALAEAVEQNRVKEGDRLVLVGFGGGLTWGASVLVW